MASNINIKETSQRLTISILPPGKFFVRLVLAGQAIFILYYGISTITSFHFSEIGFSWYIIFLLIALIIFFLLVLAVNNLLRSIVHEEVITVTKESLSIRDKYILRGSFREWPIDDISSIGLATRPEYTPHPMDNAVVDFTGLGAQEKQLQYIIEHGSIALQVGKHQHLFANQVPSWEAEDIIERIVKFSGNRLNIDKATQEVFENFKEVDKEEGETEMS